MRKLNTADLFSAARAVKSSGLRQELQTYIKTLATSGNELDVENVGISTILQIIEVFAEKSCEAAIYEVLSGPFELSAEEVGKLDLDAFMDGLEFIAHDGGLSDFFRRLSGILGKN